MSVQQTISPVDGSVYVERALADEASVDAVLHRAVAAQRAWRSIPLAERVALLEPLVPWMVSRAEEVGAELSWQMGRPVSQAPGEVTRGFQERATWLLAEAAGALADEPQAPQEGFERFIRHEPLGVVLVVAPWNYPYLCSVNSVLPALLAGNAVVLKSASQTPLVSERWAEGLAAVGLPDGVFQYVHADHATVARMVADPRVGHVAFTGSVEGGHAIVAAAVSRFVGTGLELGGKDPAYVRSDAPVEATAAELVDGAFFNSGQSCCGVERIYVHRDRFDEFVDSYASLVRDYQLGDPLDPATNLGPMVRTSAARFVRDQVSEAVAAGASALVDPAGFPADDPGGPYLAPQVLVGVDHSMRVMVEESFGPVIGIMPVAGDDEAVALMNDSPYGLTASIWTADLDVAMAVGDRVDTGTIYLNRCDHLDPALSWTGVGDSGRGTTLSVHGFHALTRPKSFHLRRSL